MSVYATLLNAADLPAECPYYLTEKKWQYVTAHLVDRQSIKDIATSLGVSYNAVYAAVSGAVREMYRHADVPLAMYYYKYPNPQFGEHPEVLTHWAFIRYERDT